MSIAITPTDTLLERAHLIPDELVALPQWVVWKMAYPHRDATEKTKVPFQAANGKRAKANDPTTWATFDMALQVFADRLGLPNQYLGIGFVFSDTDPYVGIDFDQCISNDIIAKPVRAILRELGGYAEISPSRTGIKCWVKGSLPTKKTGRQSSKVEGYGQIEMYHRGRFFAATGWSLEQHEL